MKLIKYSCTVLIACLYGFIAVAQVAKPFHSFPKLVLDSGVTLTIDEPGDLSNKKPTQLIVYALPNGNTTAQTFGKILKDGDDWHFDIQHIGAQTAFIRKTDPSKNYIVVYAENTLKSWPAWRRNISGGDKMIGRFVDTLKKRYKTLKPKIMLSGHSGGGSFLFGYLNAFNSIPADINRIALLDATYGYETGKHHDKLEKWLKGLKNHLEIIAYNDSVVIYNGKPLVSPTGGTWYRSKLMASDLQMKVMEGPDRIIAVLPNAEVILLKNPEGKIYHTVLVEKNGFIHSVFNGTKFEGQGYLFWGDRAYTSLILN